MGTRYPSASLLSSSGGGSMISEIPTGFINGTNTTFTLDFAPRTPTAEYAVVFQNGLHLQPNVDYNIVGATITFALAPVVGDTVNVLYAPQV